MKLYIRTEANAITAGGHMMRCLAIADEVKKLGRECVFITAEEGSAKMAADRGFETIVLNRPFDELEGEIPLMKELIRSRGIERLLVDSYYVTASYLRELNKETAVAYIDDLHERVWDCSYIINYSVYAGDHDYENEYPGAKRILGCSYVPLRSIYRDVPEKKIRADAGKILVLSGAADPEHFLLKLAEYVKDKKDGPEYTLIAGRFNADTGRLAEIAEGAAAVRLLGPRPDLRAAFEEADMAVTAGGVTMYEMAACGTPGISYISADNQLGNARGFDKLGLIPFAGDIRKDFSYEKLHDMCAALIADTGKRKAVSGALRKLTDGRGAERIAKILTEP
ncbi:MAG: UDP-2,4-diacetamido-2,4,6-trideoxy-beta-L-altropyranose hydrolase [Lachnospiraceae bacterium]|nr:UDP-2,4-diacetamido-2,4,6-trideoxy-beta-L-altropyranose hydrolase [Lachnospiraceae bacterium]